MASKYWIKLYHEILDDPKMGQLPDNLWRRCIELFLMAGEHDRQGQLPGIKEIAWKLRLNTTELEAELNEIAARGIIEKTETGWLVVNFAKRQAAADSTERSRQQRQREKKGQAPTQKQDSWAQSIYKSLPESPGIYLMRCAGSERYYVGGSVNIQKRVRTHLTEIKSISQHPMHSDLITYGAASFSVEVLELVDDSSQLAAKEVEWMSKYPADSLYNTDPGKRHHSWNSQDDKTNCPKNETKRPIDTDIQIQNHSLSQGEAEETLRKHKPFALKLVEVCGYSGPEFIVNGKKIECARSVLQLIEWQATIDQLDKFPGYWWGDVAPTFKQIVDDWGRFLNWLQNPQKPKREKIKSTTPVARPRASPAIDADLLRTLQQQTKGI